MDHPDEGTIHAWLDGALPPDESKRIEAHVASCGECSAAVAEARGLIAASSRILTALDEVPGGVVPKAREGGAPRDQLAALRAKTAAAQQATPVRRRGSWLRPGVAAAAALAFVAVGTYAVTRRARVEQLSEAAAPTAALRADSGVPGAASENAAEPTSSRAAEEAALGARTKAAPPNDAAGARAEGRVAIRGAVQQQSANAIARTQPVRAPEVVAPLVAKRALDTAEQALADFAKRADKPAAPPAAAPAVALPKVLADRRPSARDSASPRERFARLEDVVTASGQSSPQRNERESKETRRAAAQQAQRGPSELAGCYESHWASLDGRPLAIAPVRTPARVALDTTVAVTEVDPPQYMARDLTGETERDGGVMRWRPVDASSFELYVTHGGDTQRIVVAVAATPGDVGRHAADEAMPTPSGARVLLLAERVGCEVK